MPCMCGDYCCPSCGPAQGNWKCPICNAWASEGCEHISEKTGNLKRQYRKQAEAQAKAQADGEYRMWAVDKLVELFNPGKCYLEIDGPIFSILNRLTTDTMQRLISELSAPPAEVKRIVGLDQI